MLGWGRDRGGLEKSQRERDAPRQRASGGTRSYSHGRANRQAAPRDHPNGERVLRGAPL